MASSSDNASKNWNEFIEKKTIKDVLDQDSKNFKLIQCNSDDKIPQVLKKLVDNKIQSMPCWDESSKKYIGLIDMLDMVAVVVTLSNAKDFIDVLSKKQATWMQFLLQEHKVFSKETVSGLSNLSERNPWCPVWEGTPLNSLMDMFGKHVNLHRVPVVNEKGDVIGIISQSRVIKYLAENLPSSLGSLAVSKFHERKQKVFSIKKDQTALDGFRLLLEKEVSGIAVLNEDETLFGSFSASDLKGSAGAEIFIHLYNLLQDYLDRSSKYFNRSLSLTPISVKPESTLEEVLKKLNDNHIHRVFVVDEKNHPISIITLSDLITNCQL